MLLGWIGTKSNIKRRASRVICRYEGDVLDFLDEDEKVFKTTILQMDDLLGGCPRIGAVARESPFESDFSII